MTETVDDAERWRQRYNKALDRFRDDENQWRELESALRKLVARLCSLSQPDDDGVRERLAEVRALIRRDTLQSEAVSGLEQRLATAALRIQDGTAGSSASEPGEATPAMTPPPGMDKTTVALRSLVLDLVRRLPEDLAHSADVELLSRKLREATQVAEICDIVVRVADQLALRVGELERERERLQAMLAQVSTQLRGIEVYFDAEGRDREAARASGEGLNRSVLAEVAHLNDSVNSARDLGTLQREVRHRLSSIDDHLKEFRQREEQRLTAWEERVSQQKSRIESLENEMQVIQHRLRVREREVLTDALTTVANRQAYDERIKEEVSRYQRQAQPFCLAAIDIDYFKKINDNHGHQAGDRVLQTLARHMQRYLREQDFVARYGGEEFVVLFDGYDLNQAFKAVDKLRKSVESLVIPTSGRSLNITISAGVAGMLSNDSAQSLFERADKALYEAKNAGRNRCVAA